MPGRVYHLLLQRCPIRFRCRRVWTPASNRWPEQEVGWQGHGQGRFVDEIRLAEEQHCCFLRSPIARGRIVRSIRPERPTQACQSSPAQRSVTSCGCRSPLSVSRPGRCPVPGLAENRVAFVGQPIAAVLASSRAAAEDAVEQVVAEFDQEPARVHPPSPNDVFGPDRPRADLDGPAQGVLTANYGMFTGGPSDALVTGDVNLGRAAAMPIETRGVLAAFDDLEQALTVWLPTQMPNLARMWMAEALGCRSRGCA